MLADRLARDHAALKRKLGQAEAIVAEQKTLARLLDSRKSDAR